MANRINYARSRVKTVEVGSRRKDDQERSRFYASAAWRRLRASHLAEHPLCVKCLDDGQTVMATIVHHVIERLADPSKALDTENLESVCDRHHTLEHMRRRASN